MKLGALLKSRLAYRKDKQKRLGKDPDLFCLFNRMLQSTVLKSYFPPSMIFKISLSVWRIPSLPMWPTALMVVSVSAFKIPVLGA